MTRIHSLTAVAPERAVAAPAGAHIHRVSR
jgi:hypothetical protein